MSSQTNNNSTLNDTTSNFMEIIKLMRSIPSPNALTLSQKSVCLWNPTSFQLVPQLEELCANDPNLSVRHKTRAEEGYEPNIIITIGAPASDDDIRDLYTSLTS